MPVPLLLTLLDYPLAFLALYLLKKLILKPHAHQKPPLPPGPKGLPFIGNALQMPTVKQWKVFSNWQKTWGDVIYLSVFGQPIVVINSAQAATDMFETRSRIYSDRPFFTMGGELIGWELSVPFIQNGPLFRRYRRDLRQYIGTPAHVKRFAPIQELEAHRFLRRVLHDPSALLNHIRLSVGGSILKISHGYDIKEKDDPLVNIAEQAMHEFAHAFQPGAFAVDTFPSLKHIPSWFPGATFHKTARQYRKTMNDFVHVPLTFVKEQLAAGTAVPSFSSAYLSRSTLSADDELTLIWGASAIYGGGADTTVSGLRSFFLAMMLHPEVMIRAQAEIDTVVGTTRFPAASDRPQLPYVDAVVKEVLRWGPILPLGIPRRVCQDDVYNGYLIPKDAIIIPNIWLFLHDPARYRDPEKFNPGRFMPTPDGGGIPEKDPRTFCFGFGRRICPGFALADASIFVLCSSLLWAFNISKPTQRTESGEDILVEPKVDWSSTMISHPIDFKCKIKPRSENVEALIRAAED